MQPKATKSIHPLVLVVALLICGIGLLLSLPPVYSDVKHADHASLRLSFGCGAMIGVLGVLFAAHRWRVLLFAIASVELVLYVGFSLIIVSNHYKPV